MNLRINLTVILLALLLFAMPTVSISQYFQRLYDIDSSQEWGWDIFLRDNNNYFIVGWSYDQFSSKFSTYNVDIDGLTNNVIGYRIQRPDSPAFSIGPGIPSEVKKLIGGGFIVPVTQQWHNSLTSYFYSAGGLLKLNSSGGTVFKKVYADTANYFDLINACARLNDGTYLIGGARGLNTPSSYRPYLLIHTDSLGDTLWTKKNQKYPTQFSSINNIIPLADGRIVIGAITTYKEYISGFGNIDHNTPWFVVLDSVGNITKDTVYGSKYMIGRNGICGELYSDIDGGYIMIGNIDSLVTSDPSDPQNFPAYITHLDTNFRITWITELPYTNNDGHRQGVSVRQLHDGTYLIVGDSWDTTFYDKGFAAKISRTGDIIWSHTYISQPIQNGYLRDAVEKPDGNIVLTGQSSNDTLPIWHQHFDMWLVGVDSNGCEVVNCGITAVPPNPIETELNFFIFPNPTNGKLSVKASKNGKFIVYDLFGRKISNYTIHRGEMDLQLPSWISSGLYISRFISDDGSESKEFRIVYQP